MIGLKLINVVGPNGGNYDYKGLDINKFVPGTQVYPTGTRDFYVITEQEDIPVHEDIHLITTEEFESAYEAERNRQHEPGPIEELKAENEELRRQLDALQLAVMGMMDGGNA
ncbi:hypothetical protein FLT15_16925 [Paenibacillus thiaminolyticus]|uniref:hypothetical protein n=1 Tax=Paenibacillus thiaminolyticus TaxID=49283 RepID=UPI0011633C16|nr:hypothetical protein [Paenibacillus thiaminolyticus]NGP59879.1 hypothetical protein [Paenibacillus thiaminolyticus]NGP59925.1 hypothetical protein [Paenibacillus thiaminolyticus]NGP59971.1 hypothetical protein [Paenibacillus thiaminolyticus]